jgi:hypothetical protein
MTMSTPTWNHDRPITPSHIRLLIPWGRILSAKLRVSQPLKELLIFYGTRNSVTVFTVIHEWFTPNRSLGFSVSL